MKQIYYTLSNFHKAVKRNKPKFIICNWITSEYYFFTQKACINYASDNLKTSEFLEKWLKNQGVKIEYEN